MSQSTLTPDDVNVLARAFSDATFQIEFWAQSMQAAVPRFDAVRELWRITANTPEAVAGLEARYYVRAGLDPTYAAPVALNFLVAAILGGTAGGVLFLTPTNRATVAASAIRGWSQHRPGELPAEGISWGRVLGDTRVLVTRECV